MTTPTEVRQRVIELVDQLPTEMLVEAIDFLEFLSFKTNRRGKVAESKPEEKALLQIIQRRLPPEEQTRLDHLRQKNEMGELTEAEQSELLAYVERVECEDAERAEALIQLAKIRNVDLATLIDEFTSKERTLNAI